MLTQGDWLCGRAAQVKKQTSTWADVAGDVGHQLCALLCTGQAAALRIQALPHPAASTHKIYIRAVPGKRHLSLSLSLSLSHTTITLTTHSTAAECCSGVLRG